MIKDDPDVTDEALAELLQEVQLAEAALTAATERRASARRNLVEALRRRDQKSTTVALDGAAYRVTLVTRDQVKVDPDALKARIGARAFNALTVRRLDMAKIDQAVAQGKLDLAVLGQV